MSLRSLRAAVETWAPGKGIAADPVYRIAASWVDVVGGHAAAHCEPVALNGETLLIATRSSAWSQQLQFLSPTILAALEALIPGRITRLAFRTGMRRAARRTAPPKPVARGRGVETKPDPARDTQQSPTGPGSPDPGAIPRPRPDLNALLIGPGSPGPGAIGGPCRPNSNASLIGPGSPGPGAIGGPCRPDFNEAAEALARLRTRLTKRRGAARGERCADCEAPLEPGGGRLEPGGGNVRCAPCAGAAERARLLEIQRLVYLAPWLTLAELREQMPDLAGVEFESARRTLLARWWLMLERARRAGSISASGIERHVASSYVLLQSRLPPDRITPAIAANLLGAELAALIATSREDRGDPARSSN